MLEQLRAADIACALSDQAFRERRAMVRQTLLPHRTDSERTATGLELTFADTAALRAELQTFIALERQCCGFLTFVLSPPGNRLVLSIVGPPEAQETLDRLAEAMASQ